MSSQNLHERTWLDIMQQSMVAFLTWPKRDEKGETYAERFAGFSELLKITPLFIFSESGFCQCAPASVFTDGVNIYMHERVVNECWESKQDDEADNFKVIYNAVMKSVEWVLQEKNPTLEGQEHSWRHVERVDFEAWVKTLKRANQDEWLHRIGIDLKSPTQSIEQTLQSRKDMVQWTMQKQRGRPEVVEEKRHENKRNPVWMNDIDRIVRMRWDETVWLWEEQVSQTYQRKAIKWRVSEEIGELLGKARNAIKEEEDESKIIKEGWDQAVRGWVKTLRAMISENDWVAFGRSIMFFVKECNKLKALSFDEKAEITNTAAALFQEIAHKEAWVDLLSGQYEYWGIAKIIQHDVLRYWKSKGIQESIEGVAFYNMLPEAYSDTSLRRAFLFFFFQELLDKVSVDEKPEWMIKQGVSILKEMIRGVEAQDALVLIENWRAWAEDRVPEWFDDDDFEEITPRQKDQMEYLKSELCRTRRWNNAQQAEIHRLLS